MWVPDKEGLDMGEGGGAGMGTLGYGMGGPAMAGLIWGAWDCMERSKPCSDLFYRRSKCQTSLYV